MSRKGSRRWEQEGQRLCGRNEARVPEKHKEGSMLREEWAKESRGDKAREVSMTCLCRHQQKWKVWGHSLGTHQSLEVRKGVAWSQGDRGGGAREVEEKPTECRVLKEVFQFRRSGQNRSSKTRTGHYLWVYPVEVYYHLANRKLSTTEEKKSIIRVCSRMT